MRVRGKSTFISREPKLGKAAKDAKIDSLFFAPKGRNVTAKGETPGNDENKHIGSEGAKGFNPKYTVHQNPRDTVSTNDEIHLGMKFFDDVFVDYQYI